MINYKKKTKSILCIMVLLTLILCSEATDLGAYHFVKPAVAIAEENAIARRGFYKDSYVFLIEWNNSNKKTDNYPTKAKLQLSDRSVKTVYFDDSCKSNAKNKAVLCALKKLFKQINHDYKKSWMPNAKLIVIKTLYVGTDLEQTAKKYYPKDDIWVFGSMFPELDSNLQKQYIKKAYSDDRIDVFALASDKLGKEEIRTYTKKAYKDDKIDFFSFLSDNLDKEEIRTYAKEAYKDDRIDFFSLLSDNLDKEEIKAYKKKAYDDNRTDYISVLSCKLSK